MAQVTASVYRFLTEAYESTIAVLNKTVTKTHDVGTYSIVRAAGQTAHFIASLKAALPKKGASLGPTRIKRGASIC